MRTSANSRMVLTWHPIFEVTDREVWQEIATHGLDYHPVYDALILRLSCVFCVLAPSTSSGAPPACAGPSAYRYPPAPETWKRRSATASTRATASRRSTPRPSASSARKAPWSETLAPSSGNTSTPTQPTTTWSTSRWLPDPLHLSARHGPWGGAAPAHKETPVTSTDASSSREQLPFPIQTEIPTASDWCQRWQQRRPS